MRMDSVLRIIAMSVFLVACGGGGSDSAAGQAAAGGKYGIDSALSSVIAERDLTGNPAAPRNLTQVRPEDDPLVKLGQALFFSQTLSGSFDVSCATCHLPHMGGSDGLSLSVGVAPLDRRVVGPGRRVDPARDQDPRADGGPNLHRNSITTFNAALMDRVLMSDGRFRVASTETDVIPGGHGQAILTPESGLAGDGTGINGLVEATTKFPIINDNEMRGFLFADISEPDAFRNHLVDRLKGGAEQTYMAPDAASNWLSLFRRGFDTPTATANEIISLLNVQKALAAYVKSQIFVDNPWKGYVEGDNSAINESAKRGALLFYLAGDDGGLGCAQCHSGDRFTSEEFYNVGFPQIGRGFQRADGTDAGRWMVTRSYSDWYAHRVPSLLNVNLTAPYGHAGTFSSLESVVRYHANPREGEQTFDYTLQSLPQFVGAAIQYPNAKTITQDAVAHSSYSAAEAMLPNRALMDDEIQDLIAFLNTLTDTCAANSACRAAWMPNSEEDPDGHMLGADNGPSPDLISDPDVTQPDDYASSFPLNWPATAALETFSDVVNCEDGMSLTNNSNSALFVRRDQALNLVQAHDFSSSTWSQRSTPEFAMIAGGITATYLNDDCWPDIVYPSGDGGGLVAYENRGYQAGFDLNADRFSGTQPSSSYARFTGAGVADFNGDYRREIMLGNLYEGSTVIFSSSFDTNYREIARLPMTRSTYGMSFGDYDKDGYIDAFLAHWDFYGVEGTSPGLFRNAGGVALTPQYIDVGTSTQNISQIFDFTPKFLDARNTELQDLLIASDFGTSAVLQNDGEAAYNIVTDRSVITDENGMGAALGDIDNDGLIDWFVTSIFDPNGVAEANWGLTGNRLYKNISTSLGVNFQDISVPSGIADGAWGWGACMQDFNSDGFIDIFHVNGFGYIPNTTDLLEETIALYRTASAEFISTPSRLFINNGDSTFIESAVQWGLSAPSEGRGVICFDYDRDGDIDIGLLDHSTGIQFFENQIGHGEGRRFLNVRLVGESPNTDALGAKVYVTANVGGTRGLQRQMRISEANSNFNSQNLPDIHFGLGEADVAAFLRIQWPDSSGLICSGVKTNQFLVFDQRDHSWPKLQPDAPMCFWYPDVRGEIVDLLAP